MKKKNRTKIYLANDFYFLSDCYNIKCSISLCNNKSISVKYIYMRVYVMSSIGYFNNIGLAIKSEFFF